MIEREYGTAATISFPIIEFSLTSFHNSVTTTIFAAGDVKIAQDYGDFTNTSTIPSSGMGGTGVVLTLTAAELQAAHIDIQVIDQTATKVWEDQMIQIETFGDTTASQFRFDRSSNTVQASLTAAQTGVTVATVTDVTNAVNASITSTSVVQSVTNTVQASLTANQTGVTVATVTDITNAVNASITSTSVVSSVTNTVPASLTANQAGVTIATVTDVTNAVNASITSTSVVATVSNTVQASLTANQAGVTVATVTDVTNTVPASLTAAQSGVTIATVTDVTNPVNASITSTSVVSSVTNTVAASLTANQAGVTVATVTDVTNAVTASAVVVASITSSAIISNLGASATAQINAQMVDVMGTDTIAEQSAGAPPSTPTHRQAIGYIYMAWRNKIDTTATKTSITNDAGSTIASATISDDSVTFTKGEFA